MSGPRVWISPTVADRAMRVDSARHQIQARVADAGREATAWTALPANGARIGAYLSATGPTGRSRTRSGTGLAALAVLLVEWGVPGVEPPAGINAAMSARWSRSVTAAVLRQLRRDGRLPRPPQPPARVSTPPGGARGHGLGWAAQDGETARASAPSTETKVAAMADDNPRPSRDADDAHTHFAAVPLKIEPDSLYLQRLDAQAAVDLARRDHTAAKRALGGGPGGAPLGVAARAAADDTSATLRTAIGVLTSLNTLHGVDVSATIEVDIRTVDAVTTVAPRGELDMFTSPHLERACVERLDDMPPAGRMTVDLSAVTFLDSSGLATLVEIHRVCVENGTAFSLAGVGARSRRLLAMTRLDTVFEVE